MQPKDFSDCGSWIQQTAAGWLSLHPGPHSAADTCRGRGTPQEIVTFYSNALSSVAIFLVPNIKSSTASEFTEAPCTEICNKRSVQPEEECVSFFYSLFWRLHSHRVLLGVVEGLRGSSEWVSCRRKLGIWLGK